MRWRPAALLAMALLITSCSGDDDSATTTPAPSSSTSVETTVAPSTSAPSTTAASTADTTTPAPSTEPTPSTTQAPVDTTEPTTPPTATSDIDDQIARQLAAIEAVELATEASLAVVRDPGNDAKLAQLDEHFTGDLLQGWQNVVASYRDQNYKQIENPDQPDDFIIELASVAMNDAGTFATIQGCEITSGVVVEIGGNPDGTDRIVDDRIGRVVIELELVDDDGVWKVRNARVPEPSEAIASCD